MSIVLNGVENATAYLDDVLIWSKMLEEHLQTLDTLFQRIWNSDLKLNHKKFKCQFLKEEMKYLSHNITTEGLKPNMDKIMVIQDLKQAMPLTKLTGKHAQFEWGAVQQKAFEAIKLTLTSPPTLKYPNLNR